MGQQAFKIKPVNYTVKITQKVNKKNISCRAKLFNSENFFAGF